jgi:thiosulfate dehydrogenase (quinone) large subunit
MLRAKRVGLFLLRISLGWLFLYAGLSKLMNANWSAAGYLANAQTFSGFYAWLASPTNIGWVNFLNEWGLALVGVALLLGLATRFASFWGIVIMILYYIPVLNFPQVGDHGYIVDEHIIYAFALLILMTFSAGKYWGLDAMVRRVFGAKRWVRRFFGA